MILETLLICWINACAKAEGVNPALARAVFQVESGDRWHRYRFGPLGKKGQYIGPAGIDKSFRAKWDIDFWPMNVLIGVQSLKPRKGERTEKDILRRYNPKLDRAYEAAVMALYRQNKRQR